MLGNYFPLVQQHGWQVFALPMLTDNYCWALLHSASKQCWFVDPGEARVLLAFCQQTACVPAGVLLTHHHHDHCGALLEGLPFPLQIWGHQLAVDRDHYPFAITPLLGGETIMLQDLAVVTLATPGHTLDHLCYHMPELGVLFTGDTLLPAGCGRLMEGDGAMMDSSLQHLLRFPSSTMVACGHEYTARNVGFGRTILPHCPAMLASQARIAPTTSIPPAFVSLAEEYQRNVFLRRGEAEVMAAVGAADALASFVRLRQLRDQY